MGNEDCGNEVDGRQAWKVFPPTSSPKKDMTWRALCYVEDSQLEHCQSCYLSFLSTLKPGYFLWTHLTLTSLPILATFPTSLRKQRPGGLNYISTLEPTTSLISHLYPPHICTYGLRVVFLEVSKFNSSSKILLSWSEIYVTYILMCTIQWHLVYSQCYATSTFL